jgi:hypothetical protein
MRKILLLLLYHNYIISQNYVKFGEIMKKFIFLLLLKSCLFGCQGEHCLNINGDCYGFACGAIDESCYGDRCTALLGNCYGSGCYAPQGFSNSLPQSIINQYPRVVFTIAQHNAELKTKLTNLQKQLPTSDNLKKIGLYLQILNLKSQIDPNSLLTNFTPTLKTIKTLIPTPVPANLSMFSQLVDQDLQSIPQITSFQMQQQMELLKNTFSGHSLK